MEYGFSLGSNMGDRLANLIRARNGLRTLLGADALEQSSVYETEPIGVAGCERHLAFLNAVVICRTERDPRQCLCICRSLEEQAGRVRGAQSNAPRPLDIDIIYADNLVIAEADLIIPHPRWSTRRFVLRPLSELRPELMPPGASDSISKLLDDLGENGKVELFAENW